jgi:hypothetical protein
MVKLDRLFDHAIKPRFVSRNTDLNNLDGDYKLTKNLTLKQFPLRLEGLWDLDHLKIKPPLAVEPPAQNHH